MADMDPILDLAERFGLVVVEDACQAHGAEYFSKTDGSWKKAGSMGQAAAFSFYPGKNLGACGEAGAVVTNNASIARVCVMLRDHGQAQKYYHDVEGYNGRLDAMQAEFLRVKLRLFGRMERETARPCEAICRVVCRGRRGSHCALRRPLLAVGVSPLRDTNPGPRNTKKPPGCGRDRNGDSLSRAASFAKGLPGSRICRRRLPGHGASGMLRSSRYLCFPVSRLSSRTK